MVKMAKIMRKIRIQIEANLIRHSGLKKGKLMKMMILMWYTQLVLNL
jgi:hypothetical protein